MTAYKVLADREIEELRAERDVKLNGAADEPERENFGDEAPF
jgi:hypothetical protein